MCALLTLAIVLSASAALSSPVPKHPLDIDTEVDKYFDDWKKDFPQIKISRPRFDFAVVKDPFTLDDKDVFDDTIPLVPRKPLFPVGFSDDFFKNIREKFNSKNATNNTVENTREVDGHVIHEKESTYSNGDENGHIVFKQKTVIIRPKDGTGNVDKKFGSEGTTSRNNPKPVEYVPQFTTPSATANKNNPDEDVEMVHNQKPRSYNEAIQEGNSVENNYIVDLSRDTRINDLYRGPIEPKAVFFDVNTKRKTNRPKENPNAQLRELSSNDLKEENDESSFINLEHDTDVNAKTHHLQTEEDAELIDTNTIRKKRKNKYSHNT